MQSSSNLSDVINFLSLDQDSSRHFPAIRRMVRKHAPKALHALYARIGKVREIAGMFGSPQAMQHAQRKQLEHWDHMFARPLDSEYLARAENIGTIHARIGLEPKWYVSAYGAVLDTVIRRTVKASPVGILQPSLGPTLATLVKVALVDMQVALSTYFAVEHSRRTAVVDKVSNALSQLAQGNLNQRLDDLPPEYARLSADFATMCAHLEGALSDVATSANRVDQGASEIRHATADLASRTEKQAATLEETAAAIREMSVSVIHKRESGAATREVAGAPQKEAIVNTTIDAIGDIASASKEMTQIVDTIENIAFQTTLLALNAGVEAARAGDAGKGFAVVASEVRALALRSSEAASTIKQLIDRSSGLVDRGVGMVEEMGQVIGVMLNQINTSVGEMDMMTQQNAAMVEEVLAATHLLVKESQGLMSSVSQFDLRALPPPAARQPVQDDKSGAASNVTEIGAAVRRGASTPPAQHPGGVPAGLPADGEDRASWVGF